ncbi:MAG: hypothetical protein OQL19_18325 [Gammaproteobacteria bacterium]|nr:hypothetical protein [Gammaproteobacteria bacterium]
MQNIPNKTDGIDTLPAIDFNSHKNEIQDLITESGQTLAIGTTDQLRKGVSVYSRSHYVADSSGVANTLTLARPNSLKDIPAYFDGLTFSFSTANANTGAVTATFAGLASKKVRTPSDTDLIIGDILANEVYTVSYESSFDTGAGAFVLYKSQGKKLWQNQAVTITPPTDADYTLTATENGYGRLVLADGSWTATHNIIVDNTERSFLVDNSSGTYTATVKTSAGTGIAVLAGTKVWLLCDGTNVIESVSQVNNADTRLNTAAERYVGQPAGQEIVNANAGEWIKNQCTAWVTLNLATTTILDSFNVASIAKSATGKGSVTFAEAMDNTNYGGVGFVRGANSSNETIMNEDFSNTKTINTYYYTVRTGVSFADSTVVTIFFIGGKA